MRISDWSSDVCSSDLWRRRECPLNGGHIVVDRASVVEELQLGQLGNALGLPRPVDRAGDAHQRCRIRYRTVAPQERAGARRSEERRGGKVGVRTCRSRWEPYHEKKNKNKNNKT